MNKHPAIVPFIGFYEENLFGYIVEEEISNGSIDSVLSKIREGSKNPLFDDTHKLIISYGISCAMEYLHHKSIIHRNIGRMNILLDSELHPYLSSFFLSTIVDSSSKKDETNYITNRILMNSDSITIN